jgi:hypothetical protein
MMEESVVDVPIALLATLLANKIIYNHIIRDRLFRVMAGEQDDV